LKGEAAAEELKALTAQVEELTKAQEDGGVIATAQETAIAFQAKEADDLRTQITLQGQEKERLEESLRKAEELQANLRIVPAPLPAGQPCSCSLL
jgi:hypothetical protein